MPWPAIGAKLSSGVVEGVRLNAYRGWIRLWLVLTAFSTAVAAVRLTQRAMLQGWESALGAVWNSFVFPPLALAVLLALIAWVTEGMRRPPSF